MNGDPVERTTPASAPVADPCRCTGVILSYHRIALQDLDPWGLRVSPSAFTDQMSVLTELGEPISLGRLADGNQLGSPTRPAIFVTFDDGYVDNLLAGLPILRRFQVPATAFITTGFTGAAYFWWEALDQVFLRPGMLPDHLELSCAGTRVAWALGSAATYSAEQYAADRVWFKWGGEPESRMRLYFEVYDTLWKMPHEDRLARVEDILAWSGVDRSSLSSSRPMTQFELQEFSSDPLISIGGHSVNHLPLDQIPEEAQAREITDAQTGLESALRVRVDTYAYPHGKYTSHAVEVLRSRQFACACTTRKAILRPEICRMELPRVFVGNWSKDELRKRFAEWFGHDA